MYYLSAQVDWNQIFGITGSDIRKLYDITDGLWDKIIGFGIDLLISGLIFFAGRFVLKILRKMLANLFQRSNIDQGVVKFLDSIFKVLGYLIIAIIICAQTGIQTASLITLLGTAGVSIGLALQGSLSNFAGGVLILVGKPFVTGNYIKAESVEGTVVKIDILYTTLLTVDNKMIKLPNGTLSNSVVVNYTYEGKRRCDVEIGIRYEDDLKRAVQTATEVMNQCPYILKDEPNAVVVRELAESAVKLEIRLWSKTEDYWPARFYLNEHIKTVFDKEHIHIPYNQLDVHLVSGSESHSL